MTNRRLGTSVPVGKKNRTVKKKGAGVEGEGASQTSGLKTLAGAEEGKKESDREGEGRGALNGREDVCRGTNHH